MIYIYIYTHTYIHFFCFDPEGLPYKFLVFFCSGGGHVILQRL